MNESMTADLSHQMNNAYVIKQLNIYMLTRRKSPFSPYCAFLPGNMPTKWEYKCPLFFFTHHRRNYDEMLTIDLDIN